MLNDSLRIAIRLASDAAREVQRIYDQGFNVETKDDGSPVTDADKAANEIILKGLAQHFPDDLVLSEETPFNAERGLGRRIWMVDPLDGTKDFVSRTGDFAVMIGLCIAGRPALGAVAAPALNKIWFGAVGEGAWEDQNGDRRPLTLTDDQEGPLRVLVSRKHRPPQVDTLMERFAPAEAISRGSVGVKCALVAGGIGDVYLHPTPGTHAWDCCAPEAIIHAAGGRFTHPDGRLITYDPERTANMEGILAAAPATHERIVRLLKEE